MSSIHVIPVLLSVMVGLLLALVVWGFQQSSSHEPNAISTQPSRDVMIWLLVLAAFVLGVFIAYAFLNPTI